MTIEETYTVIQGCIAEDRKCQEFLYKTFYKPMMNIVQRYIECPHIAEEIMNNGFLRIFKNMSKYTYKGSFEGWMKKIMFREVANAVKSDKRISTAEKRAKGLYWYVAIERETYSGETYSIDIPVYDNYQHQEDDIWMLIDKLPTVTKSVFKLYLDGFVHKEISEKLNMSEGTSKWHVNQARNFLKPKLL